MLRGTNQEQGKPFNKRIVLELIRRRGPIARTDIADRIGLTVQTVSTIVRELEDDGYLLSERERPNGRGMPPSKLAVNPDGGFAIGIYITPLGVEGALINMRGDVVANGRRDAEHATPDQGFALIRELVADLKARDPERRLLGVGMAMPGPFGVEFDEFCRIDDDGRMEGNAYPGSPCGGDGSCPHISRPTWPPRRSASSSMAVATISTTTTISSSGSALAARWCKTVRCCAAIGEMPGKSAMSPWSPTASPVLAATAAVWSATFRWRRSSAAA